MYDKPVNSDEMNGPIMDNSEMNAPPQIYQQPPPMYQNPPPQNPPPQYPPQQYPPTYQPPVAQPVYQPPTAQAVYQPPIAQPVYQPPVSAPIIQVVQTNNNAPTTHSVKVETVTYHSSNTHVRTTSISAYCPFCKKNVMTAPETSCNFANFLCFLFTYPFIFIPWCWFQASRGKEISCLDAIHKCPICGSIIGNYSAC